MTDRDLLGRARDGRGHGAVEVPEGMPVLSRGKHRRPREGGCFMEFASYLAGERWSDHPACTQPLLASLARLVNDSTTDAGRGALAPLVPAVVGLRSDDPRFDAVIARRCALVALPRAPIDEQRALAVGLLAAERMLARLDGRPVDGLSSEATTVLAAVPAVRDWALAFAAGEVPRLRTYRKHAAPTAVRCAVQGTLAGGPADSDRALADLLERVVDEARAFLDEPVAPVDHARWAQACALLDRDGVPA